MALPFTGPQVTLDIIQGSQFQWGAVYGTTTNVVTPIVVTPFSFAGYLPVGKIRTQPGGPLILDISPYTTFEANSVTGRIDILIPAPITALMKVGGSYDLLAVPSPNTATIMILQGAVNLTLANTT